MSPPDTKEASGAALRTLTELVRNVAVAPDEAGVRSAVAKALESAFGYQRIAIFLVEPDGGLVLRTVAGTFPPEVRPGITVRPGEGLVGLALSEGDAIVSDDTATDDRYREVPGLPCLSEAAIPIRIDAQAVGVLDAQSVRAGAFGAIDVDVLESVARLMGVAVARVRLLESLEKRRADAEEATSRWRHAVETKDRFLSSVSHEFRTPLTSIRSFAEILLTHGVEDAETTREFVSIIHDESVRMSRLVNDLLDFSKMQAGRMTWEFTLNPLGEAVRRATASVASIAALKRVTIEVEESTAGSFVFDLDRVIQVLVNLLGNAVKFSPEGESVVLIAEPWEGGARVAVRDRGPGIDPEHRTRVFERYQQLGGRDRRPGTGLGLSISREIVLAHGGRIWADASPEGGGEFAFHLPATPPEAGELSRALREPEPGIVAESASGRDRLVLVVEDDPSFRRFLTHELERGGYRVVEAEDGVAAIAEARKRKPQLILLDVMLPHLTGRDVLAVLASDPDTASIPVVVLTAVDPIEADGMTGVAEVIRKPVDRASLFAAVSGAISADPEKVD